MIGERTRHARNSKAWYNALSRYYDTLVEPFQGRLRRRGIDCLSVSPDDHVLDVGCGTGHGISELRNAVGPNGHVIGIDVAEQMCQFTRNRIKGDGSSGVVRGDARGLPFDTDSFDAVLVSFTLELFAERDRTGVLGEVRRVLTSGGKICVIAPSTAASDVISHLYERLNDAFPIVVDSRPLDVSGVLAEAEFEIVRTQTEWVILIPVECVVARRRNSMRD